MEFSLRKVTQVIRERIWLIVIATIAAVFLAFLATKFLITPKYTSTATLYVQNVENRQIDVGINMVDLSASIKLVDTYIVVMESDLVMDRVAARVGNGYKGSDIRGMFSAASEKETEVLRINVQHEDPLMAQNIAEAVLLSAPSELMRVVKAGAVEVIDHASLPTQQSSPDMTMNLLLGALIGLALSLVIVLLSDLLKVQIKDEQDLTETFTIAVIGAIPEISNLELNAKEKV